MMGPRQEAQGSLFYQFSLEDHVPTDHLMRSIDRFVDLSGIRTVNGGVKTGHWAAQKSATLDLGVTYAAGAAASQPRSPDSWRLTGRLGPPGPIRRGSAQAVSVDLRARLCARR